jgi:hypothetical protein
MSQPIRAKLMKNAALKAESNIIIKIGQIVRVRRRYYAQVINESTMPTWRNEPQRSFWLLPLCTRDGRLYVCGKNTRLRVPIGDIEVIDREKYDSIVRNDAETVRWVPRKRRRKWS